MPFFFPGSLVFSFIFLSFFFFVFVSSVWWMDRMGWPQIKIFSKS